jgi:hypothetical protein
VIVAFATLAVAVPAMSGTPATAQDGDGGSSTTSTAPTTTSPGRGGSDARPTGQVAYITPDGTVMVGLGEAKPAVIGSGAAVDEAGQGAIAIAPTADLVAWVRADGALVTAALAGGPPSVLATDVALASLGQEPILAWNSTGDQLSYVAVGTDDLVVDRGDRPTVLSNPDAYPVPIPEGTLGAVVRTVARNGDDLGHIGAPNQRDIIGVNASPSDPILVFDSQIPGTGRRYTLSSGGPTSSEVSPTLLSADDPDFAPDGSFIVAVGPAKGRRELLRIGMDDLERKTIAQDDGICGPAVSPDATRIVYAAGKGCNRLMLVSSLGGQSFDITPLDTPDTAAFGASDLGWTTDGKFVTFPTCTTTADATTCTGAVNFLEPDTGRIFVGPEASTVAPIRRPLVQDVWVDVDLRGPLEFRHSFLISPDTEGKLTDDPEGTGTIEATLTDGAANMQLELTSGERNNFLAGTLQAVDPDTGIDRTFLVVGRANVLGVRIFSISGVWYSTDDLPFATGEFNMAVRRR